MGFAIIPPGYSLSPGSFTGQYPKPYPARKRPAAKFGGAKKKAAKPAKKKTVANKPAANTIAKKKKT